MKFGPLGAAVFARTYSRPLTGGGQEEWSDTVSRVVSGNSELAGVLGTAADDSDLQERIEDMRIIPAGRHLWASGSGSGLGLFNCHRAGWGERLSDHFTFTFDQLMLGGGVGANYSDEYLDDLPPVKLAPTVRFYDDRSLIHGSRPAAAYCIADSREGWVAALRFLIEVAAGNGGNDTVTFDTSYVREAGSPIKGFGGVASGPAPLCLMLAAVSLQLKEAFDSGGHLTPLQAMGIDHEIAKAVISGNVRRSARMSILHWRSTSIFDFISCKINPEMHWSTNISVEIDGAFWAAVADCDTHAVAVLDLLSLGMLNNGEPGFFNSELSSVGETGDVRSTNPCGEIALEASEPCVLGSVNLAHPAHTDPAELLASFSSMARFLVRATLAPSSDPGQQAVKAINRRIGVGFFGFQEWLAEHGLKYSEAASDDAVAAALRSWHLASRAAADFEADRLGVARPVKVTAIAPTGSIAKLPGVSEGMHPAYARHFVRRIRYADNDAELGRLRDSGYPVEPCIYSAGTSVVSFFVEDPSVKKYGDLIESVDEIPLRVLLETQALVQREFADNAVSFTANVEAGSMSAGELSSILRKIGPELKGTTIFPDLSRPQSPMQRMTQEDYDAAELQSVGQAIDDDCSTGACPIR